MKRTGCERPTATPTARFQPARPAHASTTSVQTAPGGRDGGPAWRGPADVPAAEMQPMPFPGPFAFLPAPVEPPATAHHRASLAPIRPDNTAVRDLYGEPRRPAALLRATLDKDLHRIQALLESGKVDVNEAHGRHGTSVLMLAARRGQAAVVRMLLDHPGIVIDQMDRRGYTALILAALNNRPEIVDCLLRGGAQINRAINRDGAAALHLAADAGHAEVVRTLAYHPDIQLDQLDIDGNTALLRAAWKGRREVVACLLVAGARTDCRSAGSGAIALTGAAYAGHVEVVRMLLDVPGVDVNETDGVGNTALMCALAKDRREVLDCLLAAGATMRDAGRANQKPRRRADSQTGAPLVQAAVLQGKPPAGAGIPVPAPAAGLFTFTVPTAPDIAGARQGARWHSQ